MARRANLRRGVALVEVLAAILITSITVLGAVGLYARMARMTQNIVDDSMGASLCRRSLEEAKSPGFASLVDGTTTLYYDQNGNGGTNKASSTSRYSVTTVITSDLVETNGGSTCAASNALRTISIVVRRISDNAVLEQTATYVCRGGV